MAKDDLMKVYQAFTTLADARKGLTNEDIVRLLEDLGFRKQVEVPVA
jgi:hypothetical protein